MRGGAYFAHTRTLRRHDRRPSSRTADRQHQHSRISHSRQLDSLLVLPVRQKEQSRSLSIDSHNGYATPTHSVTPVSASRSPDLDLPFDSHMSVATHSPSFDSFSPSATPALPSTSRSPSPSEVFTQVYTTKGSRLFHSLTLYLFNSQPPIRSPSTHNLRALHSATAMLGSLSLDATTPF